MDNSNSQTLIIEFSGPEEKIQDLLEKLEKQMESDSDIEINAVTIRKN
jgi:hypothetical protein